MREDIEAKFNAWKGLTSKNLEYHEFNPLKEKIFNNFFCIECGLDHNNYAYIIGYKKVGNNYKYPKPKNWDTVELKDCSISYIVSNNEPYNKISIKNKKNQKFIKHNIVYYGDKKEINMAEARNISLDISTSKYTFILDVDTLGDIDNYKEVLNKYSNLYHHGILNLRCLKDPSGKLAGNSFYFASNNMYKNNSFYEKFKGFYYEDTEYMLNWSRIGYPITIIDVKFTREEHKPTYNITNNNNKDIFIECLINGR